MTLSLNSNTLYFLAFSLSLSDDGFVGASCGTSTFGLTGASTCMATRGVRSESTVREAPAGAPSDMSARAGTMSADAGPSSPQSTTSGKQAFIPATVLPPARIGCGDLGCFLKFSTLSGWHLLDRRPRVLELCAGVPESNERFSTRKELFPFRFRFRAPSRPDTHPIDPPTMPPTRRNSDCGLQASKASKQTGKEANKQRSNEVSKQVQELNTSDAM